LLNQSSVVPTIDLSKFGFKPGAHQRYCGTCGTEFRGSVDATTCDSCACVLAHRASASRDVEGL
jgi:hypothetical protein